MESIILAGGLGTRLKSVINEIPKPMADIKGRPFLSYLMEYLFRQGINKVILSVGYKYDVIMNYFGSRYMDMDIDYTIEDRPLGTGGAIKKALERAEGKNVVVLNGDTFFNVELKKMVNFHNEHNSALTVAVKPMHDFDRYGTVILDNSRILGFEEKSYRSHGYINGGVYVMKKTIFDTVHMSIEAFSFEEFLEANIKDIPSYAFISDAYFIDIGIPADYERAQRDLKLDKLMTV